MFYTTVLFSATLEIKCVNFNVLLARYKSFKEVSKTFLKYFVKFQKNEYDGLQSSILSKIGVLQLECTVQLLQL